MWGEIAITALVVFLILLVEHWFPWRMVWRRDPPRPFAYTIGVLGMIVPLSGLYVYWEVRADQIIQSRYLIALWIVAISAGVAVFMAYAIDWLLHRIALGPELKELLESRNGGKAGAGMLH